jgi:hypothetical protein
MANKASTITTSVVVLILFLSAFVPGCSSQIELPPETQEASKQITSGFKAESPVEIMPEESGAMTRQVINGISGKPIEIRVKYKNNDTGYQYFDQSSELSKECKEIFPDGKTLKSHVVFDIDGTTVISGKLFRPDGTLYVTYEKLPDGKYKTSRFLPVSAQFPFVSEIQVSDELIERKIFRPDGSIWADVKVDCTQIPAQVRESVYYKTNGAKDRKIAYVTDSGVRLTKVTWYRDDGSKSHDQIWFDPYHLTSVMEYEQDGIHEKREIRFSHHNLKDLVVFLIPTTVDYQKNNELISHKVLEADILSPYVKKFEIDQCHSSNKPGQLISLVLVTSNVVYNDSRDSNGKLVKTTYEAKDGIEEPLDTNLFKFFHDLDLNLSAHILSSQTHDYFGESAEGDHCRAWYKSLRL